MRYRVGRFASGLRDVIRGAETADAEAAMLRLAHAILILEQAHTKQ